MKKIKFLCFSLLLLSYSCQQNTQSTDNSSLPIVNEDAQEDFKRVIPNFPSAAEYAAIVHITGVDFNPSILADPDLIDQYPDIDEKRAAMLGVYIYDLGYCIAFEKPSYVEEYFEVSHALAIELGSQKDFLAMIMNRYDENLNQYDSIQNYFKETYNDAVKSFSDEPEYLRPIFVAGFYIEGLYNMLKVIDTYPRQNLSDEEFSLVVMPISRAVLKQKDNLKNLSELLDERLDMDKLSFYQQAFNQLNDTYDQLNVDHLIAENRGEELLNNETFNLLIDQVEKIRSQMVSVEVLSM